MVLANIVHSLASERIGEDLKRLDQKFAPLEDQLQSMRDASDSSSNSINSILHTTSQGVAGLDQRFVSIAGTLSVCGTKIEAIYDSMQTIRQEVN